MILHVLIPCARPQNLQVVRESVTTAWLNAAGLFDHSLEMRTHVREDPGHESLGGYSLRNEMLDGIDDGWVWFLDDDTLAHPEILRAIAPYVSRHPAIVVSQTRPDGWNPGCASPRMRSGADPDLRPDDCVFDIGQVILRRDLIGSWRFPPVREADGLLWEQVVQPAGGVVFIEDVLAYYNALRP